MTELRVVDMSGILRRRRWIWTMNEVGMFDQQNSSKRDRVSQCGRQEIVADIIGEAGERDKRSKGMEEHDVKLRFHFGGEDSVSSCMGGREARTQAAHRSHSQGATCGTCVF